MEGPSRGHHGVAFDFDGDGRLDIAGCRDFEVGVYLGRGDGLFDPAVAYAVPFRAREMVLADLNRDGAPDLVVSVSIAQTLSALDPPAVLLSNGDGTFGEAASYVASLYGGPMVAGDFSGDGRVDVAFAPAYGYTIPPSDKAVFSRNLSLAYVMKGDGRGALVSERVERYSVGESVFSGRAQDSIVAADLNGDGRLDLATANSASNDVSVLLGNADGTFTEVAGIVAGSVPVALAVGFFDPGATLDLAVANEGSQDVSILLGNGDATFAPASGFPVGSAPSGLVQADFNGDGVQDLATANSVSDDISVLLGQGNGTFSAPASVAVGSEPIALAVVDLDGTGGPDLAVANKGSNDVSILLGNGDGTFGAEARYPSASASLRTIRAADVNGDGRQDVAVVSVAGPHVQIFPGDGTGALSSPVGVTLGTGVVDLAIRDLDGDGRLDLATTHNAVSLMGVVLGTAAGFATRDEFATEAEGRLAAGDFDGDGLLDLAVLGMAAGSAGVGSSARG